MSECYSYTDIKGGENMKRRMAVEGARNKNNRTLPTNIKDVLKTLVDEDAVIVLKSGKCEDVEILGVRGDLLVASPNGDIKFVDIDCICEVIADPEDFVKGLFENDKCRC